MPLRDTEWRDLLEIIEDRYGNRSTILTSQLAIEHWHDHLGEATIADAICCSTTLTKSISKESLDEKTRKSEANPCPASLRSVHDRRNG